MVFGWGPEKGVKLHYYYVYVLRYSPPPTVRTPPEGVAFCVDRSFEEYVPQ